LPAGAHLPERAVLDLAAADVTQLTWDELPLAALREDDPAADVEYSFPGLPGSGGCGSSGCACASCDTYFGTFA
jgi:hypothetical protein